MSEEQSKTLDMSAAGDDFSGKPEDFARDIERIKSEMGVVDAPVEEKPVEDVVSEEPTPEPAQPEQVDGNGQPEAAVTEDEPTKDEVPEKFKTPDGKLDTEKVEKSTLNAEEALARYREKEKELSQTINRVKQLEQGKALPSDESKGEEAPVEGETFEAQIEDSIKKHGVGKTLARLMESAADSGYSRALDEIQGIREESESQKRERELRNIAKHDPQVLTEKGIDELADVLKRNPHLMNSPEGKWTAAYKYSLGEKMFTSRPESQVRTPNPKPQTAPPAPVVGGGQGAKATQRFNYRTATKEQLNAHLDKLTPDQQDAFWERVIKEQQRSRI